MELIGQSRAELSRGPQVNESHIYRKQFLLQSTVISLLPRDHLTEILGIIRQRQETCLVQLRLQIQSPNHKEPQLKRLNRHVCFLALSATFQIKALNAKPTRLVAVKISGQTKPKINIGSVFTTFDEGPY